MALHPFHGFFYGSLHRPLLGLGLVLALASCQSTGPVDPDLKQANRAMAAMAKSPSLGKSCFTVVSPNGQPTAFVDYLFSDLGVVEWPVAMDEFEAEQMKAVGQPMVPPTVQVSRNQRRRLDSKELVLRGDDANGVIVAQGYLADGTEPVFEDQWPLATAQPGPGVAQLCQSNIEMGISPIPQE